MARLLGSSGQVFLQSGPNTAIGALLGFEPGSDVDGAAGLGLSASMGLPISCLCNDSNQHTNNPARFIARCGGIAIATSRRLLRPKQEDC
jgi:hypothetical protein